MGWTVRTATEADRESLTNFACDSGGDCDGCSFQGRAVHEREVEEYVQNYAIDRALTHSPYNGHKLLLLLQPDGSLAGVVAYERFELLNSGRETAAVRLVVAALRTDLQGTSIDEHRLSSHLLNVALRDVVEDPPQLIAGRVAICNKRSVGLLARHHIETEVKESRFGNYVDLAGRYVDVAITLPDRSLS
jgi:hypothetical protein